MSLLLFNVIVSQMHVPNRRRFVNASCPILDHQSNLRNLIFRFFASMYSRTAAIGLARLLP
jgi:hypothetical protein